MSATVKKVKDSGELSLKNALKLGKIDKFVSQAEARGTAPVDRDAFDRAIAKTVKPQQSKGRTSRSPSRNGSRGK